MEILDRHEHAQCYHHDTSAKPAIELVRIAKGREGNLKIHANGIVFFMEGRVGFTTHDFPDFEGMKGQIIFLPAGGEYSFHTLAAAVLVIFRIYDPIRLCDNYSIENLYSSKQPLDTHKPRTRHYSVLEINARMWHFLDGLYDWLGDGVKCRNFFDLKIREFFITLRFYYHKEDIYDFLYLILSGDTAFSEYVRQKWHRFHNVGELAESMRMTPRQFSAKFKRIFGQQAGRWMIEGRAKLIYQQITSTNKPMKQIAIEYGFATVPQFTKFCKKELGRTPTDIRADKTTGR